VRGLLRVLNLFLFSILFRILCSSHNQSCHFALPWVCPSRSQLNILLVGKYEGHHCGSSNHRCFSFVKHDRIDHCSTAHIVWISSSCNFREICSTWASIFSFSQHCPLHTPNKGNNVTHAVSTGQASRNRMVKINPHWTTTNHTCSKVGSISGANAQVLDSEALIQKLDELLALGSAKKRKELPLCNKHPLLITWIPYHTMIQLKKSILHKKKLAATYNWCTRTYHLQNEKQTISQYPAASTELSHILR